jgi:hypothetical protein
MNQLAAGRSQCKNPLFRFNRHLVYNLSRPETSLQPLARATGGYGLCTAPSDPQGNPVFADDQDPDYQKLLAAIRQVMATGVRLFPSASPNRKSPASEADHRLGSSGVRG